MREINNRLNSAIRQQVLEYKNLQQTITSKLISFSPKSALQKSISNFHQLQQRITTAIKISVSNKNHTVDLLSKALNTVSPLATLDRGYAIVKSETTNKIIYKASEIEDGDNIRVQLSEGELIATIKK